MEGGDEILASEGSGSGRFKVVRDVRDVQAAEDFALSVMRQLRRAYGSSLRISQHRSSLFPRFFVPADRDTAQCIGRRNYTSFFAFLLSGILTAFYAIGFSVYHITSLQSSSLGDGWLGEWQTIGSFVVAVLAFVMIVPCVALFLYHIRLVWSNRTTIEMVRPLALSTLSPC